ncbi:MAG: diacylglycerol kinase family lipid kinase [Clostridia bacterium]|nr:diacylglycerol kinase family lipid kinase [Clostridia bacterium]
MKHYFIINPAAGKGQTTNDLIAKIVSAANAEDINFRIYITKKQGDATRYVTSKCEAHLNEADPLRFYACGGDGTLNEVINAAVNYPNAEVAVIPVGTGNDYVKNFSNTKFFMNMRRQIRGKAVKIDLIKFNGRYCANVLNVGFDCSVVIKMSEFRRNPLVPSKLAYVCGILSALAKEYGSTFRVQLDDEEPLEKEFLLAAFGKGSFYGGGFKSLPLTIADDGYIDTCVATKISRLDFIKCVGKYKKGEHLDLSFISYKKCRKVHLESDEPIGVCADGEVTMETCVDVEVVPRALSFSVPEGCELPALSHEDASAETAKDYDYQEV